jgi:tetratricopeptide (TPR) repeat protein
MNRINRFQLLGIAVCLTAGCWAGVAASPAAVPEAALPSTPREFFNVGTRELRGGKLREAEASLETALASQNTRLQPPALYNLGHVRFGLGLEELKKGPAAKAAAARGRSSAQTTDDAIRNADEALASNEVQKMVASYLHGRGARKDLKAATQVVRNALKSHGAALSKWQRSSGDFKSAIELNQTDADAQQNADTVDRYIAKLIDSLRELEQLAAAMGNKGDELKEKLRQLKGRIPAPDMPPGAAGDEDEEEDTPEGQKQGQKEGTGKEGEQMSLSPEEAGWLLNGFKLDSEHRLPMGQENNAQPKERSGPTW